MVFLLCRLTIIRKEYYKRIGFDFSIESYENLANEFIEQYENRRLECKLQRDAKKMLSFLHNEGLSQSILSAYRQTSLKDIIRFFSLDSYFVKINGLDNHYAKSKIEIGKKHVASLDFPDEAIALIGDTIHDYTVAQTIGVNCILIPSGHQSKKRLESTSSILLESLADIEHLTTKSTC